MRLSWMIGGAQGLGVDTSANVFGAAVARAGYYIFGSREYFSNIKGRHSYFNVLLSDSPQHSVNSTVNILATFDAETIFQHYDEVTDFLIYDKGVEAMTIDKVRSLEPEIAVKAAAILEKAGLGISIADVVKFLEKKGVKCIGIDYGPLMKDIINQLKMDPFVAEKARNMLCAGASFGLLGLNQQYLLDAIKSTFKNAKIAELDTLAAQAGFKSVQNSYNLKELPIKGHRVQLDGNTISAIGKLYGGLSFQSYYPITPASDESTYIEANQVLKTSDGKTRGVVVLQTEDELAAINAANGAALTGARAATATSGPGFSLMNEGISWAGMNEVPVLVTYYMRGSPATGLPTRSGQSDLLLAVNVGHGEFTRIVIASGDHAEVFSDAVMALNLAELCQTPAIHIIEKTLANAYAVMDEETITSGKFKIERGKLISPGDPENYKRFELTEDGISPRAPLGHAHMYYTGDEHNEYGHITEESENRIAMYEKRIKKGQLVFKVLQENQMANSVGSSDTVILTWGSPKGAILDAMEELKAKGISVQMVQVRLFSPYPSELMAKLLSGKKRIIAMENNYTAQGARLLTENTGIKPTHYVLKWNGRPMTKDEVVSSISDVVKNDTKKVVLNGGK